MGLLLGGLTFGGIFFFEIWWAYYPVGLLSGGLTYGILRYCNREHQTYLHVRKLWVYDWQDLHQDKYRKNIVALVEKGKDSAVATVIFALSLVVGKNVS